MIALHGPFSGSVEQRAGLRSDIDPSCSSSSDGAAAARTNDYCAAAAAAALAARVRHEHVARSARERTARDCDDDDDDGSSDNDGKGKASGRTGGCGSQSAHSRRSFPLFFLIHRHRRRSCRRRRRCRRRARPAPLFRQILVYRLPALPVDLAFASQLLFSLLLPLMIHNELSRCASALLTLLPLLASAVCMHRSDGAAACMQAADSDCCDCRCLLCAPVTQPVSSDGFFNSFLAHLR